MPLLMPLAPFLSVFVLCFALSAACVGAAIPYLRRRGVMDAARVQSSHEGLIPRGGGIGVLPVILGGWAILLFNRDVFWPTYFSWIAVLVGAVLVCYLSWRDDVHEEGLSVGARLVIQILAVALPLVFWPLDKGHVLPSWVPDGAERFLLVLGWMWFLNLFNFMDGINGISGVQAMSIAGGIFALTVTGAIIVPDGIAMAAVIVAGAAAGFLVWNMRTKAAVFLGDTGSIGLGYCLAWLLIIVAAQDYLIVCLLLALVYLSDATFTILKRGLQGKKIWQAHREHCYHMATVKGAWSHRRTVATIFTMNLALLFLAFAAAYKWVHPFIAMGAGLILVAVMLRRFWLTGLRANARAAESPPSP